MSVWMKRSEEKMMWDEGAEEVFAARFRSCWRGREKTKTTKGQRRCSLLASVRGGERGKRERSRGWAGGLYRLRVVAWGGAPAQPGLRACWWSDGGSWGSRGRCMHWRAGCARLQHHIHSLWEQDQRLEIGLLDTANPAVSSDLRCIVEPGRGEDAECLQQDNTITTFPEHGLPHPRRLQSLADAPQPGKSRQQRSTGPRELNPAE
ncbi:hypothetical protein IWX50DRAFT_243520 [Phyllosticta citricarpa]